VKTKRCSKGFVIDGGSAALRRTGTGAPGSDGNEDLVQGGSMSDGRITCERKERERGDPSPVVSFTSGGRNRGGGAG
jgi:hypothetical protein